MKGLKKLLLGLMALCTALGFACGGNTQDASQSSEKPQTQSSEEVNSEAVSERESFEESSEESAEESVEEENSSEEEVHIHEMIKTDAKAGSCLEDGNIEYYTCDCGKVFADEEGATEITAEQILVKGTHSMAYHSEVAPVGKTNGMKAYYTCSVCDKSFSDEQGSKEVAQADLVIVAAMNIPDFLVEVEEGKEPVVLQLSDPQLCNWGDLEKWCYSYIRETVAETKPDLIIITGDVIYGRFDPKGDLLKSIIAFMEGLQIPWAPVFGNHDNESLMGVDWQCAQLEEAEYCLFEQGDLTGNGNYSVGIAQGNELLRVFYMLDSNGCSSPMCDSNGVQTKPAAGTNVVKTSAGFGQDQIDWYTEEINAIHAVDADVKISFAYHIQQAIFEKSFKKYPEYDGKASGSVLNNPLNLDKMETADDTDFGYVGRAMKGAWDGNYTIFNGMKALGVDSIFVGHEHCNSASIVYEGVRFQFSQKSSMYDRYNSVSEDGTIIGGYLADHPAGSHELMGGTVIPVSSKDGSIGTGYIYYAGNPFYFEPKPVELPVNGLKLDSTMLQSGMGMTIHGTAFSETLNAYKIYSEGQGKLYFAPALAAEYDTFTFTALVPEDSANTGSVEFYLRVKPTNNLEGSDGKYIYYSSSQIPRGEWKTFTVDISSVGEDCTEFSLMFAALSTTWLRDVEFANTATPDEGGDVPTPEEIVVEGLQFGTDLTEHVANTVKAVRLEDGTTAYEYVAISDWNKLYICQAGAVNANALKGKRTISFDIMLTEDTTANTFALRIKPNPTDEQVPGITNGYLYFDVSYTGDRKVVKGEWKTITIDISSYADVCTEFAIYLFAGTTAYVRNITIL